jgi:hypothetical protein
MCSQRSILGEWGNDLVTSRDSRHSRLCHRCSRKAQFLQGPLRQKGLVVTGVFSRTLTNKASIGDLQPLVMYTADGQVTRP